MEKELDELSTPAARQQFKKDDAEIQVRTDFYRYQLCFYYYDLFQRDVERPASTDATGASTDGAAGSTATS